jgi:hypothetical protein
MIDDQQHDLCLRPSRRRLPPQGQAIPSALQVYKVDYTDHGKVTAKTRSWEKAEDLAQKLDEGF